MSARGAILFAAACMVPAAACVAGRWAHAAVMVALIAAIVAAAKDARR